MAGVTDWPFRSLCSGWGAALYVNQMITARALVEENSTTWKLAEFGANEVTRSIQLYGTDPKYVSLAVQMLKDRLGVDHIDMNFGCPAPKVTRNGGGAAIQVKRRLLAAIVDAAVEAAGETPVTIKFRKGIDQGNLTFLDSGRIAQESGCAAVTLHARTANDLYSGHADWDAIAELVQHIDIPVFGNGDIWEPWDALRMMRHTGAAGVEVGRGCLGRPWLFADLVSVLSGEEPRLTQPNLGLVAEVMLDHLTRLLKFYDEDESVVVRRFRKHAGWYVAGWPVGKELRRRLHAVNSFDDLAAITQEFDQGAILPPEGVREKRSHPVGTRSVALTENWLADPDEAVTLASSAVANVSGG